MKPTYSNETLPGFVAIEGVDGSGTSTQTALLERRLRAAGRVVQSSTEPTGGFTGTLIRQIMRGRATFGNDKGQIDRQLAYLFAADRHDHLYNELDGIVAATRSGAVAITTRYYFSSYAYNARTAADFDLVDRLNRDFPLPEVVIYLTVPLETSEARLKDRAVREFYEQSDELKRVMENYARIFDPIRDRVIEIESCGDPETIADKIFDRLPASLAGR